MFSGFQFSLRILLGAGVPLKGPSRFLERFRDAFFVGVRSSCNSVTLVLFEKLSFLRFKLFGIT